MFHRSTPHPRPLRGAHAWSSSRRSWTAPVLLTLSLFALPLGCNEGLPPSSTDAGGSDTAQDACEETPVSECARTICDPLTAQRRVELDDTLCDDGLYCNGRETCDADLGCIAGEAPTGDDGIACTVTQCEEASDTLVHVPNSGACDDGLFCNGAEQCDPVVGCVAGTPPRAPTLQGDCAELRCSEALDRFEALPLEGYCADEIACNGLHYCEIVQEEDGFSAACAFDPDYLPDDGNACTYPVCDMETDIYAEVQPRYVSVGLSPGLNVCGLRDDGAIDCNIQWSDLVPSGVIQWDVVYHDRQYTALHLGEEMLCALDQEREAWCASFGAYDAPADTLLPVLRDVGRPLLEIVGMPGAVCARDDLGAVWCADAALSGNDGVASEPVALPADDPVVDLDVSFFRWIDHIDAAALTESGRVYHLRRDEMGDFFAHELDTGECRMANLASHQVVWDRATTCGLDVDGYLCCWRGSDEVPEFRRQEFATEPFESLTAGRDFYCGVRASDGHAVCTSASSDELGDILIPGGPALNISMTFSTRCVALATGEIICTEDAWYSHVRIEACGAPMGR